MKYTLVYRERDNGYNWSVRNQHGLYAAWIGHNTGKTHIRGWQTATEASDYVDKHMGETCVWAPWPDEKTAAIKPVTTAASYKPSHGGYPDISEQPRPLVWPVIPQVDDGSNEEASTVPEALVHALAQRVFVIRLRNAIRGY